jgi:lipid-A-disaccharide synthase
MQLKKVAIIVGETSGDIIGADLVNEMRSLKNNIHIYGVGGEKLSENGLKSFFPMDEISYIGPWEIILNINKLRNLINKTVKSIVKLNPEILIIIDCPEFSHRVAKKVRKISSHIPIVNYVSPTIWAWRKGRASNMRSYIDHVLSIFPFEPELYKKLNGPNCTYVGNPLSEKIMKNVKQYTQQDNDLDSIKLILMLGSRESEVNRLIEPCVKALDILLKKYENLSVKIITFEKFKEVIIKGLKGKKINYEIVTDEQEKYKYILNSDLAIVASGSATLELAIARLPMVVIYKTNIIFSIFRFFIKIHSIVLPNIIHKSNIIPELYQLKCKGSFIAKEVIKIIEKEEVRAKQLKMHDEVNDIIFCKDLESKKEAARIISNYL